MWNHCAMATTTRTLTLVSLLIVAAACGSDDDSTGDAPSAETTSADATETTSADGTEAASTDASEATTTPDDGAEAQPQTAPPSSGGGGATLTLANGETFEFPTVLCTLESQMSAGSEILFTATSYDDPGLDITQFGDEGTITGVASISVYDGDYETLWEANSMFGSPVELTLDGSTIRGTASFRPGPDLTGEPVEGEVVANC